MPHQATRKEKSIGKMTVVTDNADRGLLPPHTDPSCARCEAQGQFDEGGLRTTDEFKVASLNCNRAFVSIAEAVFDMARQERIHALCIQEAGVWTHENQLARVRDTAKRHGFAFTFFGEPRPCPQTGYAISVIIFTTLFARAGPLPHPELHTHPEWIGRAVLVHIPRHENHPLTLTCLYAHQGDVAARNAIITSVVEGLGARMPKRDYVVFGDFNCTRAEGAVATLLANTACKCANDSFDPVEPVTRLPGTRCIDYALNSHAMVPIRRTLLLAYRDHLYVQYDYPAKLAWPAYDKPIRPKLNKPTPQAETFHLLWEEVDFDRCLLEDDVEAAWKMLSTAAETLLRDDDDEGGVPRHKRWEPTQLGPSPAVAAVPTDKAQEARGTFRFAKLHRIYRQARELLFREDRGSQDHDLRADICDKIRKGRHMYPGLLTHPLGSPEFFDAVAHYLKRETERARRKAIDCFCIRVEGKGGRTKENLSAQRRWIKARIQEKQLSGAPTKRQVQEVKPPFDQAVHTAGQWANIWNAPHPADQGRRDTVQEELQAKEHYIREFLQWIPEGGYPFPNIKFDPHKLRAIAREGQAKAPGGDDWRPADIANLPMPWWENFAKLWERVTHLGACPRVWGDIVVALLDKDDGSQRPLSIASALWRTGATAMVRQMEPWINQWAPLELSGGLPDRTAAYVHARLAQAFDDKKEHEQVGAVFEDLSKAFDNVDVGQCLAIWRRLGAPENLLALIRSFYSNARRLFTCKGWLAPGWVKAAHSLLQGCPFSTILLGALMACWVRHVKGTVPAINIGVFVDDRSMWATGPGHHVTIKRALEASKPFDEKFKCQLNVEKTQVLGNTAKARANLRDIGLGDKEPSCKGKLLGLIHHFHEKTLEVKLDPKAYGRCMQRLKLIRHVASAIAVRRLHVRTLALSQVLWAGAIAQLSAKELKQLRAPVQAALLRWDVPKGASQYLTWNVRLGPLDDPYFLAQRAALAMVLWFDRRRDVPGWHHAMGARAQEASPLHWNPEVRKMVLKWGWGFSTQERYFSKILPDGRTTYFRFGIDGDVVLRNWLVHEWRTELYAVDGRAWAPKDPVEEDLAQGLRLPRPPREWLPVTFHMGRRIADYWHQDNLSWQIRVGVGGGHAFIKKKFGLKLSPVCACGKRNPSTPHVVWNCPAMGLRSTTRAIQATGFTPSRMPANTAEERLLAPVLEQPPLPYSCTDEQPAVNGTLLHEVKAYLTTEWAYSTRVLIGTDGGAKFGLASWAVALGCDTVGDAILGEDYVATAAEIMALFQLLGAIAAAVEGDQPVTPPGGLKDKAIDIATDCKPAIRFVTRTTVPHQRYRLYVFISEFTKRIRRAGVRLRYVWVPSHDKVSPNFVVPEGYCEEQLRIVNRRADDEATSQLKAMLRDTPIVAWRKKHKECADWSNEAIRWATAKCRFFHAHIAKKEGIADPTALDDGSLHPVIVQPEEHRAWIQDMEAAFPDPINAIGAHDFTHATPYFGEVSAHVAAEKDGPLPRGGAPTICSSESGAIGGVNFLRQDDTLRAPQQVEDCRGHVFEHTNDYNPFSEEGDHDWLLHNEIEGLFSSHVDVDFFNVQSLVL